MNNEKDSEELIETTLNKIKVYVEKGENRAGEFYVIDSKGNLQLWDSDGWISTSERI